ncbi:molecular chaperone DnaJ [Wolbachia endosymbiont (group E) of Neria commutata]|uniref:molecular chaperone DnaJ n=1 Tax=Wolbachia endosymbiont (group E) of Neria commutata TaxID=3066149 RepID=UPI003132C40A
MGKFLTRGQLYHVYYCGGKSFRLLDLFSSLGIDEKTIQKEVISHEFDEILDLVGKRFRTLSRKCHPDKENDAVKKKIAEEEFKKLSADKKKLEESLDNLKNLEEGQHFTTSTEQWENQTKTEEILSHRRTVLIRALLCFTLVSIVLNPVSEVEFCLFQLAANGSVQNIAYQFYAFTTGIWPWLFILSSCVVFAIAYKKAKEGGSLEENNDNLNRRMNDLNAVNNCVICIASIFAVCSLVSEVAQNGWSAQYGAILVANLALDLLLLVLLKTFIEASELYSKHCIKRLYEQDAKFSYEGELAWYDPCRIFMPLALLVIRLLYGDFIQEKPQQHADKPEVTPVSVGQGI